MRGVLACVCMVIACSSTKDEPRDASGSGSGSDAKAMACRGVRDCTPDDQGCAEYTYEQRPPRCDDICYSHECCSFYEGGWHVVIYDCARPADAGVDAP